MGTRVWTSAAAGGGTFGPFKLVLCARLAGRAFGHRLRQGTGPLAPLNLFRAATPRDARLDIGSGKGRDLWPL
ncbi:hypothetical protein NDU88_009590 [Pleurodeles waltl]|uniref:Uncharacterized protein n=1 Tax=Pleurodeles waltl TaxID=8319 RepID=A0AAV7S1F5_PLEWA|nr:hypothetical protein NDU88_009590 [Pleurodeles waltl]